jgi:hypothetical protein
MLVKITNFASLNSSDQTGNYNKYMKRPDGTWDLDAARKARQEKGSQLPKPAANKPVNENGVRIEEPSPMGEMAEQARLLREWQERWADLTERLTPESIRRLSKIDQIKLDILIKMMKGIGHISAEERARAGQALAHMNFNEIIGFINGSSEEYINMHPAFFHTAFGKLLEYKEEE